MKDDKGSPFALRIVTVDYYLSSPLPNLDVAFSDFRGSEVKQVPVLRIFGITPTGQKTCMHVHGVFPYLYIPCEESCPEPKLAYQIANSIDKALNISLKHSNSNNQHVYKVTLVKGIPFYGFHTKHHQFYKIFFYNPIFVKRTGDLLQSGGIMGVSYQPHEAHINYIMQFFIDFNLYGMSFINLQYVKFRRKLNSVENSLSECNADDLKSSMYLPDTVQFTSTCECEVDGLALHILNRKEILDGNLGLNPGLEFLWEDERRRHENLNMSHEITPTQSQIRENVIATDSHEYFDKKLRVKVILNSDMSETFDSETTSIFESLEVIDSLPKDSLNASIYPAETPDDSKISNATRVMLHHPSSYTNKCVESFKSHDINSDTIVNEDIVIQHSQNSTSDIELDFEDLELMNMLGHMEHNIENDSILCSQPKDVEPDIQQEMENFSKTFDADLLLLQSPNYNSENINSNKNEASQSLVWNDSFWENVQNISQLDGTWDEESDQCHRRKSLRLGLSRPSQKRRKVSKSNQEKVDLLEKPKNPFSNLEEQFKAFKTVTPTKSPYRSPKNTPKKSPRNFEPLTITFQKFPSLDQINEEPQNSHTPLVKKKLFDLPLTSKKMIKSDIKCVNEENSSVEEVHIDTVKIKNILNAGNKSFKNTMLKRRGRKTSNELLIKHTSVPIESEQEKKLVNSDLENTDNAVLNICNDLKTKNTTTPKNLTASQYDRKNEYIPQPGTSNVSNHNIYNVDEEINSSFSSVDEINNQSIISFYNTSNYIDSSAFFYDAKNVNNVSQSFVQLQKSLDTQVELSNRVISQKDNTSDLKLCYSDRTFHNAKTEITFSSLQNDRKSIVLIPKKSPPSYTDVVATMIDFDIPKHKSISPFYSNHKDVGQQIEIGQIILKIKSNHVNSLKEFNSDLNIDGLISQRQSVFMQSNISQPNMDINNLDTLLATNRPCVLIPNAKPPSFESVKDWIVTQKNRKNDEIFVEELSQEKLQICLINNSPGQDIDNSQIEVMSISSCSQVSSNVTLTPETSDAKINKSDEEKSNSQNLLSQIDLFQSSLDNKNQKETKKLSQNSDNSDYIPCGQKVPDLSPMMEIEYEKIGNKTDQCENEDDTTLKNHQVVESEGMFSTSNAFKFSGDNYQEAETHHDNDYLTILTMEVFSATRGDLNPDPQFDPLCAIFYSILNDCPTTCKMPQSESGFIMVENDSIPVTKDKNLPKYLNTFSSKYKMTVVKNETDLFEEVLKIVAKWDPDILCGYEIEMLSWGYIFQRAFVLGLNLPNKISRVSLENTSYFKKDNSQDINKEIKLIGRITLDVWRLLRHEVALTGYSFENVTYHILHERLPLFSYKKLSFWWNHPSKLLKSSCIEYYLSRVIGTIRILQQLDLIGRTSELARLFGIQWYEVLSRGSQFRVESMMIRLSRTFNYVLVSPSVQQRAAMKAPECLPLILEPESRFYSDPIIVLDFQSLYPSMMIAYNYCFSTCIGKIENIGKKTPFQFGASCLRISPKILKKLSEQNLINWSPCGVGFVKSSVRKGILPSMLQNILNTRFMVKKAMKKYKNNKTLQKILHSRQLGLKLIANVTYGYTAANFSGRMPCVEVGDSVVAKGRETLERAIKVVENTPRWRAKVVYGDTDSLFVLLPGRNRLDAFEIGAEIAEAVTNENPTPVKLKLEKVYQPCILQTKKRYVGYKYESKDQKNPEYEAKGIETVRRDGCPAASKILEKTLKILFDTCDVSKVKMYVFRKFQNIIEGKCNIQDFVFAREFRGMNAYKPGASVPALEIAKRFKLTDHRKEPREGERVPYVIINSGPGETLLHSARCPRELLLDPSLRINHLYYITRVIIPPLNRCLTLIGADVNLWFAEMPRKQVQLYPILKSKNSIDNKKSTISQYFTKINCVSCNEQTTEGICVKCMNKPQETMIKIYNKINAWQRSHILMEKMCQSCCGRATEIDCVSIECPIVFHMNTAEQDKDQIPFMLQMKRKLLTF